MSGQWRLALELLLKLLGIQSVKPWSCLLCAHFDRTWRKPEDDTNTKGSRAKRKRDLDFWWQFDFNYLDPDVPEATFWNLQFKEWVRLEWRFSRSLSWAQGISIVLNRYSLYLWFKGLISMEIISKAMLITVLYRNERKVNKPSKLLDPKVAMTGGLLGDYSWVPNLYI